jgi:hypothetical protein
MSSADLSEGASKGVSRRGFLAGGAMLGSWLALGPPGRALAATGAGLTAAQRPDAVYGLHLAANHILSSCLQCNTGCGIRAKLQDGVVTKIDGNPYSPWTLLPHLSYTTSVDDAAPVDGALCPKGQSGLQTAYDPYRIRKVLKRAGKRGENRWVAVPFEQAISEIVEGGRLFAEVDGEESREVEGLRSLLALRDPEIAAAMAADCQAIWDEKDPDAKRQLVTDFQRTHADHLDVLIDPDHPDLGPKNNQLVLTWGRLKDGRGDIYKRFADAFGSVNAHGTHDRLPGLAVLHLQGHQRAVHRREVHRGQEVLLAGRLSEQPFRPVRRRQPVRRQLRTDQPIHGPHREPRQGRHQDRRCRSAFQCGREQGVALVARATRQRRRPGDGLHPLDARRGPLRRPLPGVREPGCRCGAGRGLLHQREPARDHDGRPARGAGPRG